MAGEGGDYICGNYGNISTWYIQHKYCEGDHDGLDVVAVKIRIICNSQKKKVLYFSKL